MTKRLSRREKPTRADAYPTQPLAKTDTTRRTEATRPSPERGGVASGRRRRMAGPKTASDSASDGQTWKAWLPNGWGPCLDHAHGSAEEAVDHALELIAAQLYPERGALEAAAALLRPEPSEDRA